MTTDILVIGSGIAGLSFALRAAEHAKVIIVTKKELAESNTNYAQGGIAAVQSREDSFRLHIRDTLRAGDGLCNEEAVQVLVREGPAAIRFLLDAGVGFTREGDKLLLTREGGHSKRRIAYSRDTTGREIERTLVYLCRHHPNIRLYEEHIGVDLLMTYADGAKRCTGATIYDTASGRTDSVAARCVVLASGGYGQIFEHTSNPKIATGDGVAMAFRAGAEVSDMEFMQFHPTALNKKGKPHLLISETVRGEGGYLLNAKGKRFMQKISPAGELAPRDVVSLAIGRELKNGPVWLDVRHLGETYVKERFPFLYEQLWWCGIKMDKDLIPVAPAAHYSGGGIKTDTHGRTNIQGLYAFGEVAATGVHGANRLASNSLLESVVFAKRAWLDIKRHLQSFPQSRSVGQSHTRAAGGSSVNTSANRLRTKLKSTMWHQVGLERDRAGISKALEMIGTIAEQSQSLRTKHLTPETMELANMATVAWLTTFSALLREESRGGHYRRDFPHKDSRWRKHIVLANATGMLHPIAIRYEK